MLLVTNALLVPVAPDAPAAVIHDGWMLVSENGVSTNPLAVEATAKVHEQLPALAAEHGWPA